MIKSIREPIVFTNAVFWLSGLAVWLVTPPPWGWAFLAVSVLLGASSGAFHAYKMMPNQGFMKKVTRHLDRYFNILLVFVLMGVALEADFGPWMGMSAVASVIITALASPQGDRIQAVLPVTYTLAMISLVIGGHWLALALGTTGMTIYALMWMLGNPADGHSADANERLVHGLTHVVASVTSLVVMMAMTA